MPQDLHEYKSKKKNKLKEIAFTSLCSCYSD